MHESPLDTGLLIGRRTDQDVKLVSYLLRKLGLYVLDSPDVEDAVRVTQKTQAPVRLAVLTAHQRLLSSSLDRLRTVIPLSRVLVVTDVTSPIVPTTSNGHQLGILIKKPFRRARFLGSVLSVMAEAAGGPD